MSLPPKGYRGFGSFHCDSVETLIAISEQEYIAPPLPEDVDLIHAEISRCLSAREQQQTQVAQCERRREQEEPPDHALVFGKAIREWFLLDSRWTFLNHGAFGSPCRYVFRAAEAWRRYTELQPLAFIDRELFPQLVHTVRKLAHFMEVKEPKEVVLLPNATTGLFTVINSITLRPNDALVSLDLAYGSVKTMLKQKMAANASTHNVVWREVMVLHRLLKVVAGNRERGGDGRSTPCPSCNKNLGSAANDDVELGSEIHDEIVSCLREELLQLRQQGYHIRLCVFDHVTSNTALVLPVERLAKVCHEVGNMDVQTAALSLLPASSPLSSSSPPSSLLSSSSSPPSSLLSSSSSPPSSLLSSSSSPPSSLLSSSSSPPSSLLSSSSSPPSSLLSSSSPLSLSPLSALSSSSPPPPSTFVLIDGAHALGMFDIKPSELGVDFYVANCHKWLLCPRGCAVMYAPLRHQHLLTPLVISHGYGSGFLSQFIWDGARDYSASLSVLTAISFYQKIGGVGTSALYCRDLVRRATAVLQRALFPTGDAREDDRSLFPLSVCGSMALIPLPRWSWEGSHLWIEADGGREIQGAREVEVGGVGGRGDGGGLRGRGDQNVANCRSRQDPLPRTRREAVSADAKQLQDRLHSQYWIEVPVKTIEGRLYFRISAHIYNDIEDYELLGRAMQSLRLISQ